MPIFSTENLRTVALVAMAVAEKPPWRKEFLPKQA